MKKLLCVAMVSTLVLSSSVSVDAAGLKDIFDAEYYAEQYTDLKKAFGNNEKALYNHFLHYGLQEGRVMNPIIDVGKYRQQYGDLEAAFGDDWDAYVNHYFTYGVNEHRDNGTDFDLLAYVESYKDIKDTFGNDYVAIAEHYAEFGRKENRKEGSKEFIRGKESANVEETYSSVEEDDYVTEQEPENDNITGVPEEQPDDDHTTEEETKVSYENTIMQDDGSWIVEQYDDSDVLLRKVKYGSDGDKEYDATFVFDENLFLRERTTYYYNDNKTMTRNERLYNEYGMILESEHYIINENNEEFFSTVVSWYRTYDMTQGEYDEENKVYYYREVDDNVGSTYPLIEWVTKPNGIVEKTEHVGNGQIFNYNWDEKEIRPVGEDRWLW